MPYVKACNRWFATISVRLRPSLIALINRAPLLGLHGLGAKAEREKEKGEKRTGLPIVFFVIFLFFLQYMLVFFFEPCEPFLQAIDRGSNLLEARFEVSGKR